MLIEQLIGDLLVRHNCVVVPAFGGFVAKQTAAVIDAVNGVMLPPKKSLLFNKQLINNDGLLIAYYAKETGKSYDDAAQEINAQVAIWQKTLHAGERITLEKVGYLFLDQEKNIGFEQDRYFNLLLQSYGLGKVHFISEEDIQLITPVQQQIVVKPAINIVPTEALIIEMNPAGIEHVATAEEVKIRMLPEKTSSIKLWKYVAAAVLIPVAFYSYWIPMQTKVLESGVFAFQDFNPFHAKNASTYKPKPLTIKGNSEPAEKISVQGEVDKLSPDVATWSYSFDDNLYIPVRVHGQSSSAETKPETIAVESPVVAKSTPTEAPQNSVGNYHLIANCFGSEDNATKFVKYLQTKGFDAKILDVNKGLHRVSAGSAQNSSALSTVQEKIENLQIEGSWIVKK